MNTLKYYEQYRTLSGKEALLEGQLRFINDDSSSEILAQIEEIKRKKADIENSLENYIPYALPPRLHYKALEEREFLFYRCLKGLTMMQTAELMCVSRDTVYRIRRRISTQEGPFTSVTLEL